MKLKNEKGIALVISFGVIIVLLGLSSAFMLRAVHESNMSERERALAKAQYISEGGTQIGLDELDNLINNFLQNTVNTTNPSTVISSTQNYVTNQDGIGFLIDLVEDSGTEVLTLNGSLAEYVVSTTAMGAGTYDLNVLISEKTDPVTVTVDSWDFSYNYTVESNGIATGIDTETLLSGDFTVRIQRDNFAKYALFTNAQTLPSGTNVWFTDKTDFAGPIHTNGRYNIALDPSGTFDGVVEQVEQLARFYNQGSPVLLDADVNGAYDTPAFNSGFNRGVSAISLSSPVQEQDMIDQASGGQSFASNGVYVPHSGANLVGGIYVDGNSTINMSIDGSDNAVYTITQGGTTKTITVDRTNNQTTVIGGGSTDVYTGVPNGQDSVGTIIYVAGEVTSFQGTVQQDTALTVASQDDVVISNDIQYADYTAAVGNPGDSGYVPPTAENAENLLGIVSWGGDVRIGTAAPDDVNIHGTILARSGILQVDSYNNTGVGPRGTATILGGVISDFYGAFGLFSGSTGNQLSGYGRNFVYDERMESGSAPPYFPSLNTFIAFTNDITDKMIYQGGDS